MDCPSPCKFLGSGESEPRKVEVEKPEVDRLKVEETKPEEEINTNAPVSWCSLCNVEMSQAKTKFRIEGWEGSHQKLGDKEELPVIVYLCPKCGTIEFKADEKQNKS
jgi:hypothetical protein